MYRYDPFAFMVNLRNSTASDPISFCQEVNMYETLSILILLNKPQF